MPVALSSRSRTATAELEGARESRDMFDRLLAGARSTWGAPGSDAGIGNMRAVMIATLESLRDGAQSRLDELGSSVG